MCKKWTWVINSAAYCSVDKYIEEYLLWHRLNQLDLTENGDHKEEALPSIGGTVNLFNYFNEANEPIKWVATIREVRENDGVYISVKTEP